MSEPLPLGEVHAVVGDDGLTRLVRAFYAQVPDDSILGPMYPADDLEGAEVRLRDFLIFRFGGPQTYIQVRGHPRLRMRHAPFPIDGPARQRWVQLMDRALDEVAFPAHVDEAVRGFLRDTATFLINRR